MIRKVCLSIACLAVGFAVSAQTPDVEEKIVYDENPHRVMTNSFLSDWYVSLGVGFNAYYGDGDRGTFGKNITPAMDIAVGKWFTPVVGARLMYTGFKAKSAPSYDKFGAHNLHADFMLNVNNLIKGYDPERIWGFIPYVGVGWAHRKGDNEPTVNLGVLNAFSITDVLDINLDIRGMLVNDVYDGDVGNMNWEGMLTAAVGVSYKFGQNVGWERAKTVYRTNHKEANALRKQLEAANKENETLRKSVVETEAKVAEAQQTIKHVAADDIVLFPIGQSTLTKAGKVSLGSFAGMIKDLDPNTVYLITGYADKGTGSKARNEKLSKARAEAAYNCLVKDYGVNPEQLKVDYKGGVDNMFFDDPSLSRAVIISIQ